MSAREATPAGSEIPRHAGTRAQGFVSLEDEVGGEDLRVSGEVPEWLTGTLIRACPAQMEVGGKSIRHWFDGLAMLNAFSFQGGGVSYANRFLDTDARRDSQRGKSHVGLGTDPCRTLFKRVAGLWSGSLIDNANVNVTRLGERYLAWSEMPVPIEFDPGSLETRGPLRWQDRLKVNVYGAHPHHDRERDEMVSYGALLSPRCSYQLYTVPAGASARQRIAKIPVSEISYMHSFAITDRYAVLVDVPLRIKPSDIALDWQRSLIDYFRWAPQSGTRIHVVDRHSGELCGVHETDALFLFHHANAFEREAEIVVDFVEHPRGPDTFFGVEVDRLRSSDPFLPEGLLRRMRIPLKGGPVRKESLCDAVVEMPRINYGACNGRPYRFAFAAGVDPSRSDWLDRVVKIDVDNGEAAIWHEDGCYAGEPVFVPRPGAAAEDDGVLLSIVFDSVEGRSFLVVLDARSLEEVARAEAPHRLPFGLHGDYFPPASARG